MTLAARHGGDVLCVSSGVNEQRIDKILRKDDVLSYHRTCSFIFPVSSRTNALRYPDCALLVNAEIGERLASGMICGGCCS